MSCRLDDNDTELFTGKFVPYISFIEVTRCADIESVLGLAGGDGKTMFADALWLNLDGPDSEASPIPQVPFLVSSIE